MHTTNLLSLGESKVVLEIAREKNRLAYNIAMANPGRHPCQNSYCCLAPMTLPACTNSASAEVVDFAIMKQFCIIRSVNNPELVARRKIGRMTVVLDLDETLLSARRGSTYVVRPFARNLLNSLAAVVDHDGRRSIEIIIWSAGDREHVDRSVHLLDPDSILISHVICRGPWYTRDTPALKNLSLLSSGMPSSVDDWGGRIGTCVIVDDNPHVSVKNGNAALVIPAFEVHNAADTTLNYVLQVLTRAAHLVSCHPITTLCVGAADHVIDHPFVSESDFDTFHYGVINCFFLDILNQETLCARVGNFLDFRRKLAVQSLREPPCT
jgi:NLI interacting factor-like phosphatase